MILFGRNRSKLEGRRRSMPQHKDSWAEREFLHTQPLYFIQAFISGWGPPTLRRAIRFTQSTDSDVNLTPKHSYTHIRNNVWQNIWASCGPVKWHIRSHQPVLMLLVGDSTVSTIGSLLPSRFSWWNWTSAAPLVTCSITHSLLTSFLSSSFFSPSPQLFPRVTFQINYLLSKSTAGGTQPKAFAYNTIVPGATLSMTITSENVYEEGNIYSWSLWTKKWLVLYFQP